MHSITNTTKFLDKQLSFSNQILHLVLAHSDLDVSV